MNIPYISLWIPSFRGGKNRENPMEIPSPVGQSPAQPRVGCRYPSSPCSIASAPRPGVGRWARPARRGTGGPGRVGDLKAIPRSMEYIYIYMYVSCIYMYHVYMCMCVCVCVYCICTCMCISWNFMCLWYDIIYIYDIDECICMMTQWALKQQTWWFDGI